MRGPWGEHDTPPADLNAIVDPDDVTWLWMPSDEDDDVDCWHERKITTFASDAPVSLYGRTAYDWSDMFGSLPADAVVREASEAERHTIAYRWKDGGWP